MKRLSLLVAILLIATIGGVYAAFIYPGAAGNATTELDRAITLEQAQQSGNIGDFSLTSDVDTIVLDQKYHDPDLINSDYTVVMKTTFRTADNENPSIVIKFTPKVGANTEIKTNAKESYIYFGFVSSHTYEGTEIFDVTYGKDNYITIHTADYAGTTDDKNYKWTKNEEDGSFTVELTHIDTIDKVVKLNGTFVLDTIEEYNAFKTAMGDQFVNLVITATTIQPA